MTPASRTPEGLPSRCPVCGAENDIDYSQLGGDAPCPNCGKLLVQSTQHLNQLRARFAASLGISDPMEVDAIRLDSFGTGSLDFVEIVMDLEEEFDINLPDEVAPDLQTVGDLLRAIVAHSNP